MLCEHRADHGAAPRHDLQHAIRQPRFTHERSHGERDERREFRRLPNGAASRRERGGDFLCALRQREIPRCDEPRDARRFVLDKKLAPRLGMRGDAAIHAPRLLAEPLEETCRILHFARRLRIRLALLGGKQSRELILAREQQRGGAFQNHAALNSRDFAPVALRLHRTLNRKRDGRSIRTRHIGNFFRRGGIAHADSFATRMPLAVHPGTRLEPKIGESFHAEMASTVW